MARARRNGYNTRRDDEFHKGGIGGRDFLVSCLLGASVIHSCLHREGRVIFLTVEEGRERNENTVIIIGLINLVDDIIGFLFNTVQE